MCIREARRQEAERPEGHARVQRADVSRVGGSGEDVQYWRGEASSRRGMPASTSCTVTLAVKLSVVSMLGPGDSFGEGCLIIKTGSLL